MPDNYTVELVKRTGSKNVSPPANRASEAYRQQVLARRAQAGRATLPHRLRHLGRRQPRQGARHHGAGRLVPPLPFLHTSLLLFHFFSYGKTPVAPLPSALKGKKQMPRTESLLEGDLLHFKASVAGRPKDTVLPVLGYCLCLDAQGQPYALRAYVPLCPECITTYAGREAVRFPEPNQRERWLGSIQFYFSEIDLTDHAHELALERRREGLVIACAPSASGSCAGRLKRKNPPTRSRGILYRSSIRAMLHTFFSFQDTSQLLDGMHHHRQWHD